MQKMLSILFVLGKDFLEENKVMINSETKELQLGTLSDSCHTNESTANEIQITTPSKTDQENTYLNHQIN